MNQLPEGTKIEGQLLFDDFSSHTPKTASGTVSRLVTDDGEVLLEREYSNPDKLSKRELLKASGPMFQDDVAKYLREQA